MEKTTEKVEYVTKRQCWKRAALGLIGAVLSTYGLMVCMEDIHANGRIWVMVAKAVWSMPVGFGIGYCLAVVVEAVVDLITLFKIR